MKLLFLRHGENENNVLGEEGFFENNFSLTDRGRVQANEAARICATYRPTAIYASTYLRAQETADIIAAACGLEVQPAEALREINQGDWGALKSGEVTRRLKEQNLWEWSDAAYIWKAPNGESLKDVYERSTGFVKSLLREDSGDTLVFVTHSGVMKMLAGWLQNRPLSETVGMQYPNAKVYGFVYEKGVFTDLNS